MWRGTAQHVAQKSNFAAPSFQTNPCTHHNHNTIHSINPSTYATHIHFPCSPQHPSSRCNRTQFSHTTSTTRNSEASKNNQADMNCLSRMQGGSRVALPRGASRVRCVSARALALPPKQQHPVRSSTALTAYALGGPEPLQRPIHEALVSLARVARVAAACCIAAPPSLARTAPV